MAFPFLVVQNPARIQRSLDIHTELLDYLDAAEKASQKEEMAGLYREPVVYPDRPPILEDYDRFERYGWPDPGTWKDQVVNFFEDMEAVRIAKEVWQYRHMRQDRQQRFVNLPPMPEQVPLESL